MQSFKKTAGCILVICLTMVSGALADSTSFYDVYAEKRISGHVICITGSTSQNGVYEASEYIATLHDWNKSKSISVLLGRALSEMSFPPIDEKKHLHEPVVYSNKEGQRITTVGKGILTYEDTNISCNTNIINYLPSTCFYSAPLVIDSIVGIDHLSVHDAFETLKRLLLKMGIPCGEPSLVAIADKSSLEAATTSLSTQNGEDVFLDSESEFIYFQIPTMFQNINMMEGRLVWPSTDIDSYGADITGVVTEAGIAYLSITARYDVLKKMEDGRHLLTIEQAVEIVMDVCEDLLFDTSMDLDVKLQYMPYPTESADYDGVFLLIPSWSVYRQGSLFLCVNAITGEIIC